ncbi:hypothetical protein AYI68_g5159 [Smittium mucronatum]|uniref:Reverse transcriptase domain-containing protein n=1 Tax=Smittium mucronatum TaxID=133383 RepID=A0A1R0GV01_9FUNG|nr:hypothetical protein AYI68_g5159 [Smittium mucronatum]
MRQGFPASPILFNFFINCIFEGMEEMYVPSLSKKNPGLLFANDAVITSPLEPIPSGYGAASSAKRSLVGFF